MLNKISSIFIKVKRYNEKRKDEDINWKQKETGKRKEYMDCLS